MVKLNRTQARMNIVTKESVVAPLGQSHFIVAARLSNAIDTHIGRHCVDDTVENRKRIAWRKFSSGKKLHKHVQTRRNAVRQPKGDRLAP